MQRFWRALSLSTCLTIFGAPIFVTAATVGPDAREGLRAGQFEAMAAGILVNSGHTCTVTLIDRRLGLTNRHCLIDIASNKVLPSLENILRVNGEPQHAVIAKHAGLGPAVAVGLFNAQAKEFFEIKEAWWGETNKPSDDWAVVVLDRSAKDPAHGYPGDQFPTFRLADSSRLASVQLISHAGYSEIYLAAHKTGHVEYNCHVLGRDGVIVQHNCANSRGASGGPLWIAGSHNLIAINSFETCPTKFAANEAECAAHGIANGAVPIEQFSRRVHQIEAKISDALVQIPSRSNARS